MSNDFLETNALSVERQDGSVSLNTAFPTFVLQTLGGLFNAEGIHHRGPWRSFDAVEYATLEWVDWFNHCRLLEPIGNVPPADAEANYYAARETQTMAT